MVTVTEEVSFLLALIILDKAGVGEKKKKKKKTTHTLVLLIQYYFISFSAPSLQIAALLLLCFLKILKILLTKRFPKDFTKQC